MGKVAASLRMTPLTLAWPSYEHSYAVVLRLGGTIICGRKAKYLTEKDLNCACEEESLDQKDGRTGKQRVCLGRPRVLL